MGATTQVTTLSDLRTDMLNRLREQTGVTALSNIIDRYLNIALHDIHINPGNSVPWAIRRSTLTTNASYTTGTATITIATSRTAVTGASTAWNTPVTGFSFNNVRAGGKITFSGQLDVYSVASVASDTSLTLNENYVGAANLSASAYTYFEDEYALASDFFRPVDMRIFSSDANIPLVGQSEFRRRYPRNNNTQAPNVAAITQLGYSGSTTPRYRIMLHPAPDKVYLIPYDYITSNLAVSATGVEQTQLSADTDEPIIPLRYRHVLIFHALHHWYRDRKDDTRAQAARLEYIDLLSRMKGDTAIGQDRPRLSPQQSYAGVHHPRKRPGRYASGTWFDEIR